jgi:predicted Zn-dependent protease
MTLIPDFLYSRQKLTFSLVLISSLLLSPIGFSKVTGADIYKQTLETTSKYEDPILEKYITDLGEEIVSVSSMKGEKFTFTLLDAEDLNAFATRDNYIYVNRGLLNYVSNEAQLVSVLAHEVAHITRGHVVGQEEKMTGAQIISTIAAVLSASNEVYEASMAYANSLIRGHGRRNELEADETGAEYMAKLGYDPKEMLSMLSIMKDQESVKKKRASAKVGGIQTYHGIFSSHPRNDSRLRTVVVKANNLKSDGVRGNGAETYRQLTDGLIWGVNFLAKTPPPERYSDLKLNVRIDFAKDWTLAAEPANNGVSASPVDQPAVLSMKAIPRTIQSPEEYLYNYLKVPMLDQGEVIAPSRLRGFSGIQIDPNTQQRTRIAVVYYKLNAYIFQGEVVDDAEFEDYDVLFLDAINTFRPISRAEIAGQKPRVVNYIKSSATTT